MPVRWTIDHSQQFVEIAAEGPTQTSDFVKMLDALEAENAVPYKKLLDVTQIVARMTGEDLPAVAERVARNRKRSGPFAVIVAPSGPQDGLARLFVLLAEAQGHGRVFRDPAEARQWIKTQQATAEPDARGGKAPC